MSKVPTSVTMYGDNIWGGGGAAPAINVRANRWPSVDAIVARFGCSQSTAERASGIAWECQAECFWLRVPDIAIEYLSPAFDSPDVEQQGRSGGWLVVTGLPDPHTWTFQQRKAWGAFQEAVEAEVEYFTDDKEVLDLIACNEWAMDDAALENMIAEALS